jgi:hypothetical protein
MSETVITITEFQQRASEVLKYSFDFAPRLATAETITSQAVTVSPSGCTATATRTGAIVTILASGGTVGTAYKIQVAATTSNSQVIHLYAIIRILPD